MNSNKGYSLIEIAIGLSLFTIFLVCTGSLINASYTNYRLILQRSEALDYAIAQMEGALASGDVDVGVPYRTSYNNMSGEVIVENVKDGDITYKDKVFLVTVDVKYKRTPKSTDEYHLKLQSLKVEK